MVVLLLAGLACAPADMESDGLVDELRALHGRVYDVYDVPLDRDVIWDLLAGSFTGAALTREYVEHWTSRINMRDEGVGVDIRRVDYTTLDLLEIGPDYARIDVEWSVGGVVTHQGHEHPRVNRYRAVYTVVPTDDGLRIAATRVSDQERVRRVLSAGDWFDDAPPADGGFMDPLDLLGDPTEAPQ